MTSARLPKTQGYGARPFAALRASSEGRDESFRARAFAEPALQRTAQMESGSLCQLRIFLPPSATKLIFGFAERTLGCGVPITPRLSQKLQQTLGGQEGAEFVNWMHEMDARVSDVATRGDLAELRQATRGDLADVRAQLRADIAELRHEMQVGFATLETRFERRVGDLIKWSFVFWVGAVGAIAMLARALR